MYRVEVTPVVGLPQFAGWSQVVTSQGEADHVPSKQLVCTFAVAGEHAGNIGRQLTAQIKQSQIDSTTALHQLISDLKTTAEDSAAELTLTAGLFSQQKMALGVLGGSVLLKREDKIGLVLDSEKKLKAQAQSQSGQIKVLEGRHQSTDVIVLVTNQAYHFLNEIKQRFDSGFGLNSVVTSIVPALHDLDDSSLSSLAFVTGGEKVELKVARKTGLEEESEQKPKEESEKRSEPEEEQRQQLESLMQMEKEALALNEKRLANQEKLAMEAEPTLEEEPALDLPPALKLRGAGQRRDSTLDQLGQAQAVKPPQGPSKIRQFSGTVIKFFSHQLASGWSWLGSRDWRGYWAKLVRFLSRVFNGLKNLGNWVERGRRRLFSSDVYLKSRSPRQLLKLILPIATVLLLLVGGVGFRFYQVRQQKQRAAAALAPYKATLTTAREQIETEPVIARDEVNQVVAELEQLKTDFADQKKAQRLVEAELTRAQKLAEEISGQEQLDQLEIFYNLRSVDENFVTSAVTLVEQQAIFLDVGQKKALKLDLINQETQVVTWPDLATVKDLEFSTDQLIILGTGVFKQDLATTSASLDQPTDQPTEIIAEGDSNREATFIEAFASYIYVLNPAKRDIYRYVEQEEGFSDPIGWVSGAAGFDYEQTSSWAIDGDIWVATREGSLHRLAAGREQNFAVTGLEQPFNSTLLIDTNENLENLYLLEPDQARLVVLNKEGQFIKEVKSASLASTTALFVSEELGKAFAVSGSIMYSVEL